MPDAPRTPRRTSAQQERRRLLADASIGEGPEDYDPAVVPPASDAEPDLPDADIVPSAGWRELWAW